jgi:hypothetical protein
MHTTSGLVYNNYGDFSTILTLVFGNVYNGT